MSVRPSAKADRFTESVIREMTRLAHLHGAVNLSQGFPDFAAPLEVKEAARHAVSSDINQYAITWGARSLREAIAAKFQALYGVPVDPEREITVTCGSTEAIVASLLAVLDPGDEVVVFEPFYENYGPDAILSGAVPRFVKLRPPDWSFDPDELARAFGPRTRAVVINTPHNPTGKVFSRAELETIAGLCRRHDAVALTDEIYEHILYDGAVHVPIATLPGMAERTITINGMSKTYAVTGWRVGWAIAPPPLTNAIRKVHDFLTVGAAAPLQEAGAVALKLPDEYYKQLADGYGRRRKRMLEILDRAGFRTFRPRGAYYVMTDITALGWDDDVAFARHMVEEVRVAVVPGSSFYSDPRDGRRQIRFAFCKKDQTLDEAERRLSKLSPPALKAAMVALAVGLALAGAAVGEAERLAARALQATSPPAQSLADARRALSLTADFDPTDFVKAGRKGEVVEDEFVSARRAYRRHRALVYEAVGASAARAGEHAAAVRYLRRAALLDPGEERVARLARSLLAIDRAPEAVRLVLGQAGAAALSPESLALVQEAVDAAGFPSVQLEIDRARLAAAVPGAVYRDGPFRLPASRLSTGGLLRLEDGLTVLYAADAACRACSADLQDLKRAVSPGVRVVLVPEAPDLDHALRQIVGVYRYDWPLLLASDAAGQLGVKPGSVMVVARSGWAGATLDPPFQPALTALLSALGKADVRETIPRPTWNGRAIDRRPAPPPPALLPEGLAPGEDAPAPPEFDAAVAAYRAGRAADALRAFESLEANGDGWLLPPEARLDRALCLARLGRREEARRLLLRTGDSRFQDEVDRALEKVGSGP